MLSRIKNCSHSVTFPNRRCSFDMRNYGKRSTQELDEMSSDVQFLSGKFLIVSCCVNRLIECTEQVNSGLLKRDSIWMFQTFSRKNRVPT